MGAVIVRYYEYIEAKLGLTGKVELAKLTHTPSVIAGSVPDSPDILKKFEAAINKLTGGPPPRV